MIEKVTVSMTEDGKFRATDGPGCHDMNPKEMLLYAAAQCAGHTAMMLMQKMHLAPKRLEIVYSGELNTETLQTKSVFRSFHAVYNVDCGPGSEQEKASRALELTHEKYCGLAQMLRKIAPITHEIAVVSTEPEAVRE